MSLLETWRGVLALVLLSVGLSAGCTGVPETTTSRPNVILIVTDDQGYGDLEATGNPQLGDGTRGPWQVDVSRR